MFDVLILGGGVSGMSCALVLGSAKNKPFVTEKAIGVIAHQKNSNLQEAIINNAYGIPPGKLGADLLYESIQHLSKTYPHIIQIPNEKVLKIEGESPEFTITTNTNTYKSKMVVVGIGAANTFAIEGLMHYVEPHQKTLPEKQRIQLKNNDHKVAEGIYVTGTLAGSRSQVAIAAGSGAAVATDILTLWNGGMQTQVHDSIKK
ncbi:NAD(P)/FAD-dependent oxidoreductase [Flavobacterium franklandianum]|uniref:NAD(P)/FAD-dependent oxidoreductase n=2 Tax=Flavobacterium TaxID=237 RepID=A0A553CUC4_9FLAO|nr:FAD-dependent oxidoreductase [Flavobacterium franklandianum]TRX24061.1 NAD(P)/FAD-dependent oxidoreductase [Flavobacterium franklandianum]TRX25395.1 NAD(P)/FAD-dependent oxidoreductase [Flavobacterium franklandianum]